MASQFEVLTSLLGLVNGALSPDGNPLTFYEAAIGYPAIGRLQQVAKTGNAAVSIYDRKISKNSTRWSPYVISQTVTPATLNTALAPSRIAPGQQATITLGGTVTPGDGVSCLAVQIGGNTGAAIVRGLQNDTPASMAQNLTNQINVNLSMTGVLTATVDGPVVTVTNVAGVALQLASYTGNGGSQVREIGRRDQQVQIILWARTVEQRNIMVEALAEAIAESELNFGPVVDDVGDQARLSYVSDYDLEDDTLEDVYRHDFMVGMDYPVTTVDVLYAVLAPVITFQVGNNVSTSSSPSSDFSNPDNSQFIPGLA